MKKTTKILFPIDFSSPSANAFRYAVRLADHIDASIDILHVVFPEVESVDYPVFVANATETRLESAREQLKMFIDEVLTALKPVLKNEPVVSLDLEIGTAVHCICSAVKRNEIDLIILGSRGENRSGIDKLIGSVAAAVVSKASCPVMVIPGDAQFRAIQNMTYATDVLDSDPFEIWRTQELLKPFSSNIELVHINLKKDGDSKAWEKMEMMKTFFAERIPSIRVNIHHIFGKSLQTELDEFIKTHDTDLLVMSQVHHGFWDRIFFKSNTKSMALHTRVPLLIQKEE